MTVGTVLRSHAGGYLVYVEDMDVSLLCAARGRLKKERVSIITGDQVEIEEVDSVKGTAVVSARLERKNLLSRPQIANVDQVVIVQAIHQPEWNALWCDRYVVHFQLELPSSKPVLCFNKSDLAEKADIETLRSIYEPLGYSVIFVSAMTGQGMDRVAELLDRKVSVLAGPSGVGKSSLLNFLEPSLHLKVGVMENEFGVGRHTTTYSELYTVGFHNPSLHIGQDGKRHHTWVADTPGFNLSELKHPEPALVFWQFPEIAELAPDCKFANCLHLVEIGCKVLSNLESISADRYDSYVTIVAEAQEGEKLLRETSQKVEASVKVVGGRKDKARHVPKLSGRYRAESRRTQRQSMTEAELEAEIEKEQEMERDLED